MVLRTIAGCLGLCLGIALGQNSKVDVNKEEAAIRALIESGKSAPASHRVFWSGAFKRPVIDNATGDPYPDAAIGKRKNQKNRTKVERLEVAASGDMAWEYSTGVLEYDVDDGSSKHAKFETASLRVWKKEGGQWKVAALFVRPLDVPFAVK
jgi:Domain of unknown function (DUF4440)